MEHASAGADKWRLGRVYGAPRLCSETRENFKPFIRAHAASISRQVEKKNNMEQEKKINLYPEHLINKKGMGGPLALLCSPSIFVTVESF